MNASDLIQALKSATVDEVAQIRQLLRVPDAHYGRAEFGSGDAPRNLGDAWNRKEQWVDCKS